MSDIAVSPDKTEVLPKHEVAIAAALETPYTVVAGSLGSGLTRFAMSMEHTLKVRGVSTLMLTATGKECQMLRKIGVSEAHTLASVLDKIRSGESPLEGIKHIVIHEPLIVSGIQRGTETALLSILMAAPPDAAITITIDKLRLDPDQWEGWDWLQAIGFRPVSLGTTPIPQQEGLPQTQQALHRRLSALMTTTPEQTAALLLAMGDAPKGDFAGVLSLSEDGWVSLLHHWDARVRAIAILHPDWFDVQPSALVADMAPNQAPAAPSVTH